MIKIILKMLVALGIFVVFTSGLMGNMRLLFGSVISTCVLMAFLIWVEKWNKK